MVFACTSLRVQDLHQRFYHGRTLEFLTDYPSYLTYYSTGFIFKNLTPDDLSGLKYTAKYNILCITMSAFSLDDRSVIEGMNNAGFSFSSNMYGISETVELKQQMCSPTLSLLENSRYPLYFFYDKKGAVHYQWSWEVYLYKLSDFESNNQFYIQQLV